MLTPRADLEPAFRAALGAALQARSMLVPFWTIRVILIILLWRLPTWCG